MYIVSKLFFQFSFNEILAKEMFPDKYEDISFQFSFNEILSYEFSWQDLILNSFNSLLMRFESLVLRIKSENSALLSILF